MPKFKSIRARATLIILALLVLGLTTLSGLLTVQGQRDATAARDERLAVMLSVLSFDLNSNFSADGFQRPVRPDGRVVRVESPAVPTFDDHRIVDASAEQTFGLVSVLAWDAARNAFVRVSTSAHDMNGQRALGGSVSAELGATLRGGSEASGSAMIGRTEYYSRVIPILNAQGETIGALEAGLDGAEIVAQMMSDVRLSALVAVAAILLSFPALTIALRGVLKPIERVKAAMVDIAAGRFESTVPHTDMTDAVGHIARELDGFSASLEEAESLRSRQDEARLQAETEAANLAKEQDRVVSALAGGLQKLAEGDLRVSIDSPEEDPFPERYETLRASFNDAVEKLGDTLSDILSASQSVKTGAAEIDQAAGDLATRAERQAATLEQSAAALTELSTSVKLASESSSSAEEAGRKARARADQGADVMREAIQAIELVSASSENVTRIIGVIDDIAFQTNLLALNAGVEAARAGEAGKGFAVVASEVRGLAQRASESAREIKQLIGESTTQVQEGTRLVHLTGAELDGIVSHTVELQELMSGLAAAAIEQASGLDEITKGINDLDGVTQQNAAMAEQANAAASSLSHTSDDLAVGLGKFQLPALHGYASAERERPDVQPAEGGSAGNWAARAASRPIGMLTHAPAPAADRPPVAANFDGF